ncbi:MAG: site-specific DNA-methyltransferase [Methanobrevibacter sp.]|nr:site-specific DNA-methyltransferase [Methanobrevibacter sp.]
MNFEDMTKEQLIEYIKNLNEEQNGKYGLVWDKEKEPEQIVVECDKFIPVLAEQKNKNIDNGGQDNILIEGDNFHSLSVLNYTHKEMVDIIYIDPPYNTGNKDFIYNDRFVDIEDGYRHSKWLNFMSKRLRLARNLLKEDGFILISIDDNEYAQLKLLCDSIFGERNLLSIQHIQVRYENKSLNEKNDWQPVMEYVLVYAKNKFSFKANKPSESYSIDSFVYSFEELSEGETITLGNRKVTIFKPGEWKQNKSNVGKMDLLKETWASGSVLKGNTSGKFFDLYISKRKEIDGLNCLYKVEGIGEDGLGYRYFTGPQKETSTRGKFYSGVPLDRVEELKNGTSKKYRPITNFHDYSGDFGNIRHEGGVGFNSGKKPIKMLKEFINYHPNKDSIVLDFFAGSGSTGHAVLDLNKEDNGKRKFILCTNNENNICEEITYERLKNVINGIGSQDGLSGKLKYFKTEFVDYAGTKDQLYYDLTEKCIPMLCVKEETFIKEISNNEFAIYRNDDSSKFTCVYFDIFGLKFEEFINTIKDIDKMKYLYIFTLGDYIDKSILENINNYSVEPIPYRIVELYKKVVKMSKEA